MGNISINGLSAYGGVAINPQYMFTCKIICTKYVVGYARSPGVAGCKHAAGHLYTNPACAMEKPNTQITCRHVATYVTTSMAIRLSTPTLSLSLSLSLLLFLSP